MAKGNHEKMKRNVGLFSGIGLVMGGMIGKLFIILLLLYILI